MDERSAGSGSVLRGAVPLLAALFALAPAGCARRDADLPSIDAADVRIDIGLAGTVDSRRWSMLRVRALNRGGDFRGEVEIRGSVLDDDEPLVTTSPVEIAGKGGAVREILIPVRPQGWTEVKVTFRQPGWEASFRKEVFLSEEKNARMLVVARRAKDLSALESAIPTTSRDLKVIRPGDLVPHPLAYDAFQAIVLLGVTLADAPEGTAEALGRWVERGGTLLAFPGTEWAGGVPQATLDLLGIDVGDPGAKIPGDVAEAIGPAAARGFYRAIRPRQGTRETGQGVSFLTARGTGRVMTFALGPGDEKFPDEQDAPGIRQALDVALDGAIERAGGATAFADLETETITNLFAMTGSFIPPRFAVLLGVLVYLTLGFLVPWAIFNRRRRREWTYVAVIAAAAVASIGIYRYGLLSAHATAELEEVSIVRLHREGEAGEVSSFLAVVSPRHERKDIFASSERGDAPRKGDLPQLLRVPEGRRTRTLGSATIECRDGQLRLAPVTLYPNGIFYFRSDYEADPATLPRISFEGDGQDSPRRVSMANRGRVPMSVYRVARGHYDQVGRVAPGTPFVAVLSGTPSTAPAPQPDYPQYGRQSPDMTELRLVSAMVPLLQRESIILVAHEGVFPPGREFALWNAVTLMVTEVPGAD